jgi:hypothetical protein
VQVVPLATKSPVATSQYVPAASPVWNVRVSAPPLRLNATYAAEPRPNAIWSPPLLHQFVTPVPAAALRNATRFAVVRVRCSHCQPFPQLTWVVVPSAAAGGPASGSLNVKLDITCGTPYGQASMNASASA